MLGARIKVQGSAVGIKLQGSGLQSWVKVQRSHFGVGIGERQRSRLRSWSKGRLGHGAGFTVEWGLECMRRSREWKSDCGCRGQEEVRVEGRG